MIKAHVETEVIEYWTYEFRNIITAQMVHADFTFDRCAGKQSSVIISAADDGKVLYQGREKKEDEGVKGSPVEYYAGTVVSDYEAALIKHGDRHQECMTHVKRYAKSEAENEQGNTWGQKLDTWIKDSVEYWNEVNDGRKE